MLKSVVFSSFDAACCVVFDIQEGKYRAEFCFFEKYDCVVFDKQEGKYRAEFFHGQEYIFVGYFMIAKEAAMAVNYVQNMLEIEECTKCSSIGIDCGSSSYRIQTRVKKFVFNFFLNKVLEHIHGFFFLPKTLFFRTLGKFDIGQLVNQSTQRVNF